MTSRGEVREATREFLSEYPEAEPDLRAVADLNADRDASTFDDVELDSGRFGEIIARDLVEKTADSEYRLRHPDVIREVLTADPEPQAAAQRSDQDAEADGDMIAGATGSNGPSSGSASDRLAVTSTAIAERRKSSWRTTPPS